jgi:phosphate transport system substrate-binding protein
MGVQVAFRISYVIMIAVSLAACSGCGNGDSGEENASGRGVITISGAWALYPLATLWAGEFSEANEDIRINVVAGGTGKGLGDVLTGQAEIGMISRALRPIEARGGIEDFMVARGAVVVIVNGSNPVLEELLEKGMSKRILKAIWVGRRAMSWGEVAGTSSSARMHIYTRADSHGGYSGATVTWASFLEASPQDIVGIGVYGDPGVVEAVRRDPLGIGYANLSYAFDPETGEPVEGIAVLPIDLDSDGKTDESESFHTSIREMASAITTGKYPAPPARGLYLVTRRSSRTKDVSRFIRWVLTDGQKYVEVAGHVRLEDPQIRKQVKRLDELEGLEVMDLIEALKE